MNTPPARVPLAKPYIISKLFNPVIVWDVSRLEIAIKMTEEERSVISKRATGILRDSMPEILTVLSSYESARSRFAQSSILRRLEKLNILTEDETKLSVKVRRRSEKDLTHIDSITQQYRTQFGYRMTCLSLLLPESGDSSAQALATLDDLDILNGVQQTLFQGLLLEDLLRWNNYYAQAKPEYDAESSNNDYIKKLNTRATALSTSLESIKTPDQGRPIGHFLDDKRAENPVLNGTDMSNPAVTATTEFSLLRECFKRMNEKLSTQIVQTTEDTNSDHADWHFNLLDESHKPV